MLGNAKVEIDLIGVSKKVFLFPVEGTDYDDIEYQISKFAESRRSKYISLVKTLSWEVEFK